MGALTLTTFECERLAEILPDARSVELSRRDSLDRPYDDGFLIAAVTWTNGDRARYALGESGLTPW